LVVDFVKLVVEDEEDSELIELLEFFIDDNPKFILKFCSFSF
jgi:hypothetical protein